MSTSSWRAAVGRSLVNDIGCLVITGNAFGLLIAVRCVDGIVVVDAVVVELGGTIGFDDAVVDDS